MANNPRDNNQNPQNPEQRRDKANINDPARERDNDGQRRQQEAQQEKPGQQGGQQAPKQGQQDRKPPQQR